MKKTQIVFSAVIISFFAIGIDRSNAQTLSYAEAIGQLVGACGKDIEKYCKTTNLGGGRVQQCLTQNQAKTSAVCKSALVAVSDQLRKRSAARAAVARVCAADIQKFCAGVQAGDGNLLECFTASKRNMSAQCRQVVADSGYDAPISAGPVQGQINLDSKEIVSSLQGVDTSNVEISAAALKKLIAQTMADPSRTNRMNREPLSVALNKQAQLTIAIQFDLNSARIRPESFKGVGLMADALYSPYLQGYRFLVVGHTDATGSRERNLKLSQERADAIRAALISPFGISAARIEAIGLGEEQLLNSARPDAAENRHVQLINIGR